MLPYADTDMMQLHLDEISRNVAEGAHAVLLLDRAGWAIPRRASSTCPTTSRRSSCLPAPWNWNPAENVWQYLRQNWLSNTVFGNLRRDRRRCMCRLAVLIAQPETITSIGMRHSGSPRSAAMTSGISNEKAYSFVGPGLRQLTAVVRGQGLNLIIHPNSAPVFHAVPDAGRNHNRLARREEINPRGCTHDGQLA